MREQDQAKSRLAVESATAQVDRGKIEQSVRLFLEGIGENPSREGLRDTPQRVARMWADWADQKSFNATVFEQESYTGIVQVTVPFYSFCEHHLLPFFGKAHIAYIPDPAGGVLGLSKLARAVNACALKPTIQERLTEDIVAAIKTAVAPLGIAVMIEAEHLCMSMRGVQKAGHITRTSSITGIFMDNPAARTELLWLIGDRW